jgi:hypothetical protein
MMTVCVSKSIPTQQSASEINNALKNSGYGQQLVHLSSTVQYCRVILQRTSTTPTTNTQKEVHKKQKIMTSYFNMFQTPCINQISKMYKQPTNSL